ncbi:MAG TPA: hypothetical protein VJS17_12620 [Pyrinomonadaceae bacterium]|nr:hypothetical protein [Pyrinomonadaceae bacterium]
MYCPSCGSEERQLSQYCRACGTDLRIVRGALERPDAITASAVSAREQIGMAVADKIRQLKSAKDLEKVAEDVLPSFEKFLESPEEKRLRRIRSGIVTAAVGLGISIVTLIIAIDKGEVFPLTGGLITFLIGLGIIINGLLFTLPRKLLPGDSGDAMSQRALDQNRVAYEIPPARTNELNSAIQSPASITEHTTHHLTSSKP